MQKTPRISVGLSEQEYRDLQLLAEKHRVSLAWIGRHAIVDLLDRYRGMNAGELLHFDGAQEGKK